MPKRFAFDSNKDPKAFIDLERYPILDLDTLPARELIARCRRDLADIGALAFLVPLSPTGVKGVENIGWA